MNSHHLLGVAMSRFTLITCASYRVRLLVLASLFCNAAVQAEDLKLQLDCTGTGNVLQSQAVVSSVYDEDSKSYKQITSSSSGKHSFNGSAQVEISGAFARVKLPPEMIPLLGKGDGWYPVNELFVNDNEITGNLVINSFNKPTLKISRTSGHLTLASHLSDFVGKCEAVQKDAPKKF
jgi:hypothetical protein